jgi:phosphatidylglycerophosphatase A
MVFEAVPVRRPFSFVTFTSTALATGFGAGYSPVAPGTAGTLVGLILFWPLIGVSLPYQIGATVLVFALAVASSHELSRRIGIKDPGLVVVDEVIGMWISLLFLPLSPTVIVAAFLLFRLFDVVKPPPARGFESLPGGWGIVMDDVMAGIYTNLVLQVVLWLRGHP